MTVDSKESTLSRWSRRKLEARQEAEAKTSVVDPVETEGSPEPTEDQAEELAEKQAVLTDADMPDIESLTEESDFSCFMSSGVSDELRNLALRKLFRAPVFNIRDGLDEYDDDFTTFEKLGDIVTSDMKHRMEIEEQKLKEALAAEGETGEIQADAESSVEDDFDDEMEMIEDDEMPEALAAAETEKDSVNESIDTEVQNERH